MVSCRILLCVEEPVQLSRLVLSESDSIVTVSIGACSLESVLSIAAQQVLGNKVLGTNDATRESQFFELSTAGECIFRQVPIARIRSVAQET